MKENNAEIIKNKPYELYKLEATAIFSMCKIIKGIGINEFKVLFGGDGAVKNIINKIKVESAAKEGANSDFDVIEIGANIVIDILGIVIENLPKCEEDIYKFLASVSNLNEKQIRKLSMADFTQMIIDVLRKEDFADFIKVVFTLFK
jgi:hypothetical protein